MSRGSASVVVGRSAPVFAALGDETRLALLARLAEGGPWSIARLTGETSITRQAATKHLEVLAGAGLVKDARRGRERLFELAPDRLDQARRALEMLSRRWDDALSRLKAFVEE
jgi:DNA-binding transcriptional ArsR family regulator